MFEPFLTRAVERCSGLRAVVLVGMDGVPVATSGTAPGRADELVAVAYADLARKAARASSEASHGGVEELSLRCDEAAVLFRAVTAEYALLAILDPQAGLGRARYELTLAALALRPELER